MPKETIARRLNEDDTPKNVLQVYWLPYAENVQINIKIYGEVAFLPGDSVASDPELYSPSMSRKEINDLIKTLRRARDQVYGKDE